MVFINFRRKIKARYLLGILLKARYLLGILLKKIQHYYEISFSFYYFSLKFDKF